MSAIREPDTLDQRLNALDLHALILTGRRDELRTLCTENHPAAVAETLQ